MVSAPHLKRAHSILRKDALPRRIHLRGFYELLGGIVFAAKNKQYRQL